MVWARTSHQTFLYIYFFSKTLQVIDIHTSNNSHGRPRQISVFCCCPSDGEKHFDTSVSGCKDRDIRREIRPKSSNLKSCCLFLSTFCASFFSFSFFPPPHRPFHFWFPPLPGTSKLLRFLEETQYSGAGVRRGFCGGHHTEKRRNFLKKWRAKIGKFFFPETCKCGAGVRRGFCGGHHTEKRRNFLKKWRAKIGVVFFFPETCKCGLG